MKKKLSIVVALLCCVAQLCAQNISVTSAAGQNPNTFVNTALAGKGVYLFNARFSNSAGNIATDQIGIFHANGFYDFMMDSGIVMTTGNIAVAPGPNNLGGASQAIDGFYSDPQMELLATNTVNGCATLDFDFVGLTDYISFMYTFASEEYPEFVCSNFNDVFAFFITGPDPETLEERTWNVAIIPETITDSTPNGIAVAINSVNPGMAGTSGGSGAGCYYDYSSYYIANSNDTAGVQYDGYTVKLMAEAAIVPCAQYHMHLSVCNVGDNSYDSGVFLEYGSFNSPTTQLGFEQETIDTVRVGCRTKVPLDMSGSSYEDGLVQVTYGGDAEFGRDFICMSDSGLLLDGNNSFYISRTELHYLELSGLQGVDLSHPRYIDLYLATSVCPEHPELKVYDTMHFVMTATAEMRLRDTTITVDYLCTEVGVSVVSGKPPYTFEWIPEDNLADPHAQQTAAFISDSSVYQVVATDGYGCGVDTATVTINVNKPVQEELGIENIGNGFVKIYPNPVNGVLNVDAEGMVGVEMYNVKGQKVFVSESRASHLTIDTETFAAGLYYVRIATQAGVATKTVVVK
jgi:hypothetical protein